MNSGLISYEIQCGRELQTRVTTFPPMKLYDYTGSAVHGFQTIGEKLKTMR